MRATALRAKAFQIVTPACIALMMLITVPVNAAYPDRPIRLIVPFPPGGPNDILARLVSQRLTLTLGQSVTVENLAGASTIIGTWAAAKAPPDGYTLLMISPSHVINPGLRADLPYNLLRDFTPVIGLAVSPSVLVATRTLPVNTLAELLALAKSRPKEINFGSGGVGTATHLSGEMLCKFGGVEMTHIPYKGDAQATNDLFGGQIAWKFGTILSMKPQIDAGLVRPLAVSGPSRIAALPNVPTVAETIPGFDATSLYGVVVPAGTPVEIVTRLNASLGQLVESPEFRKLLTEDGATPVGGTPEQFGTRLKLAVDKWNQIIKQVGVKAE